MISEGFLKTSSTSQSCKIMFYNINELWNKQEVFFNGPEIRHCNHDKWILS